MTSGDIKNFLAGLGEVDFLGFGIQNPRQYVGIDWKREAKEKDPNKNVVRTFRPVVRGGDTGLRILVITDPSDSHICALAIGNKINAVKTALVKNPATPPSVSISMPSIMASTVNGIKCACDSCGKDRGLTLSINNEDESDEEPILVWPNYKGKGVYVAYNDDTDDAPRPITQKDIDRIKKRKPKWSYPDCIWSCDCVEDETTATVAYPDGSVDDDEDNGGRFAAHLVGVAVAPATPGAKAALAAEIKSILDAAPSANGTHPPRKVDTCSCRKCKDYSVVIEVNRESRVAGNSVTITHDGSGIRLRFGDETGPSVETLRSPEPGDAERLGRLLNNNPEIVWNCLNCGSDEGRVEYIDGIDDSKDAALNLIRLFVAGAFTAPAKTTLLPLAGFLYHPEPQEPGEPPLVVVTPKRLWEDEHHVCDQSAADDAIYDDPELNAVLCRAMESYYEWDDSKHTWAEVEALLIAKGAEEITNWDF